MLDKCLRSHLLHDITRKLTVSPLQYDDENTFSTITKQTAITKVQHQQLP